MASRINHGIQRVLRKLEASVNSGNYYEAHQMYRTLYFRYLGQKKYSDLLELLYNGAILLLQRDQHTSGADLGILYIDVLNKAEIVASTIYFDQIKKLFSIMKAETPERETFLHNAVRWSMKHTNCKWGHPELHTMIAQVFWQEENYAMARKHFVYGNNGEGCAAMLIKLQQERGYSDEVDFFIVQIVLQYLCLRNTKSAQEAFDYYVSRHPKVNGRPPYSTPLLNFLYFLLKTIEVPSVRAFTVVRAQYSLSWSRDAGIDIYLDKIAEHYFHFQPRRPQRQSLFGSMMQSFFNDLEDEDSDPEDQTSRQRGGNNASTSQAAQELD
ncbi:hypothetical protein PV325_009382 [Microctonus aethiopoides]|uniref:Golgi to ER traffic protein 4 homolog n=1 Tax=Microctonus aethiopoides TaxID=144406 RepID=A0AA39FPS3_9HYME|nr:hypothetical protein PV325_009382 [Microctonus aethiopoides]KAK0096944.1 hypothetical protein PV326_003795 [Microctonus aethiopoides]KAK0173580.1 hypothetical protein PV328_006755 [Microctonus aethiopoides]